MSFPRSLLKREREYRPRVEHQEDGIVLSARKMGPTGEHYKDRLRAKHQDNNDVNSGTVNPGAVNYEQNTILQSQKL